MNETTHETGPVAAAPTPAATAPAAPPVKRTRRSWKRTQFAIPPRPAPSVRALWTQAKEEERLRAHRTATALLTNWLGKATKAETAATLQVTPLRVWQLSQQAVSGMLAGLLTQPRTRPGRPPTTDGAPAPPPWALQNKVAQLERELARAEGLIALLKEMPMRRDAEKTAAKPSLPAPGPTSSTPSTSSPAAKRSPRPRRARPTPPPTGGTGSDRPGTPRPTQRARRGAPRPEPRGDDADAPQLAPAGGPAPAADGPA